MERSIEHRRHLVQVKMNSNNRITIKDIASHCGLSKSTVGYILSNSPHYRPSAKSKEAVLRAMKELNYKPNIAASSLRTNRTYTIGIVIRSLYDRFYSELAEHLQYQLEQRHYTGIFTFSRSDNDEEMVNRLVSRGIDGCICTVAGALPALLQNHVPVVHYTSRTVYPVDHVMIDHRKIVRESVQRLYELGHVRIGFAGQKVANTPKYDAFLEILAELRLPYDDRLARHCIQTYAQGAEYGDYLATLSAEDRPTAVITQNDPIAMGLISHASRHGLRVPEDLSVIGSNNILESGYYLPRLTTVDFPVATIAGRIVELLLARINDPERELTVAVIDPTWVPGESIAPPPSTT